MMKKKTTRLKSEELDNDAEEEDGEVVFGKLDANKRTFDITFFYL